jgi:hypothetical protein
MRTKPHPIKNRLGTDEESSNTYLLVKKGPGIRSYHQMLFEDGFASSQIQRGG